MAAVALTGARRTLAAHQRALAVPVVMAALLKLAELLPTLQEGKDPFIEGADLGWLTDTLDMPPGVAEALVRAKLATIRPRGLLFPKADEWIAANGEGSSAERVRRHRARRKQLETTGATHARPFPIHRAPEDASTRGSGTAPDSGAPPPGCNVTGNACNVTCNVTGNGCNVTRNVTAPRARPSESLLLPNTGEQVAKQNKLPAQETAQQNSPGAPMRNARAAAWETACWDARRQGAAAPRAVLPAAALAEAIAEDREHPKASLQTLAAHRLLRLLPDWDGARADSAREALAVLQLIGKNALRLVEDLRARASGGNYGAGWIVNALRDEAGLPRRSRAAS